MVCCCYSVVIFGTSLHGVLLLLVWLFLEPVNMVFYCYSVVVHGTSLHGMLLLKCG